MIDLRLLQSFVAVAEQMSFTKAANRLYISQPALSQQITELEHQLGTALFVRNKRTILLTPAGKTLLEAGRQLLIEAEETEKRVRGSYAESDNRPSFYLAFSPDIYRNAGFRKRVMSVLAQMRELYPQIGIRLEEHHPSEFDAEFASGLDVAVSYAGSFTPRKGIFHNSFGLDKYVLLLPAGADPAQIRSGQRLELYLPQNIPALFQVAMTYVQINQLSPNIIFVESHDVIQCLLESEINAATIIPRQSLPMLGNSELKVLELPDAPEFTIQPEVYWMDRDNNITEKFMELLFGSASVEPGKARDQ